MTQKKIKSYYSQALKDLSDRMNQYAEKKVKEARDDCARKIRMLRRKMRKNGKD
jgi:hypothetical protein